MEYNIENIRHLINQYFEGNTSSKEEEILRNYFQEEHIDEDLLEYRSLFQAFADLSAQPELLETDFSYIDNQKNISIKPKSRIIKYFRVGATAIAGIAACIVLFFITYHPSSDTFVIIDGKKYTDKTKIQNAFDESIENVRIDLHDVFSDLHEIVMEDE
jgi:hypothetical protein